MKNQSSEHDSWWHERPTKLGELGTGYQALDQGPEKRNVVWQRAALVVGLMFALVLSLVVMAGR
ncbi:MAG: hypothetical protein ABWZ88_15225 [Variovorax sp.]